MMAILRYAFLKTARDSSLAAFLLIPMLTPVAALAGVTLGKGHLQYPFYMDIRYTPVQNATLASEIAMGAAIVFSSICAFWTFRPEIATRSMGSFLFAARPLTIAVALILFAAAIGIGAWLGAVALTAALTSALPAHFALFVFKLAAGCVGSAAVGAFAVTMSAQPAMIVGAYLACLVVIAWLLKSKGSVQLLVVVSVSIVCTALAAFLLERRCAT